MKKIRLTESDLRDMVSRAVYRIMEETGFSPETLHSAAEKARRKFYGAPQGSPEGAKRFDQLSSFEGELRNKRDRSPRSQASVDKRLQDVKDGKRKYVPGRGWVTDTDNR